MGGPKLSSKLLALTWETPNLPVMNTYSNEDWISQNADLHGLNQQKGKQGDGRLLVCPNGANPNGYFDFSMAGSQRLDSWFWTNLGIAFTGGLYFFALSFSLKKPVLGCNKEALLPRNMVPKVSGWVRCFTGCHELLQSNLSRGEEIRAGRGDLRTQDLWGSAENRYKSHGPWLSKRALKNLTTCTGPKRLITSRQKDQGDPRKFAFKLQRWWQGASSAKLQTRWPETWFLSSYPLVIKHGNGQSTNIHHHFRWFPNDFPYFPIEPRHL